LIDSIDLGPVLGQGGMGIVYLGKQAMPRREVAVKKAKDGRDDLETMLLHEALITGMLEHPNIVPIHEIKKSKANELEIVMKRIQGVTLDTFLQENAGAPETLERAIEVLIQTCNALAFAHAHHIVHRDIKAQNIMLGEFGETYLLDWGIAMRLDDTESFPEGVVGTPAHMAPEMLSGKPRDVSTRTDIYLLGATLHHVLTGESRHGHTSKEEIFDEIRESKPWTYSEEVPPQLAALANACCHPDPTERIESVTELRERLQDYLRRRHASGLLASGQHEMEIVYDLFSKKEKSHLERVQLYHHIHRARFGFEQALLIDSTLTHAKVLLQKLVDDLTVMLLEERNYEAAAWFAESSGALSDAVQSRLDAALQARDQEQQEAQRLLMLGRSNDPERSLFSRMLLGGALCVCAVMVAYYIGRSQITGNVVTAKSLFFESLYLPIPIGLALFFARRKLLFDAVGRRATIGIVGGLICLILSRWVGYHFGLLPEGIVTTEKFLIGLAFANTPPALPSGMKVAVSCLLSGILSILFPHSILLISALLVIVIGLFVGLDIYRTWKSRS
jgi:serine/threonine-protein kinase